MPPMGTRRWLRGTFTACALYAAYAACAGGPPPPQDLYIGLPGTTETHAVITVQQGEAPEGSVWRLASTASASGRTGTAFLPDPPGDSALSMPAQYVIVAKDAQGDLMVRVDALAQNGTVVGRAVGQVELIAHGGVSLSLSLRKACDTAAQCTDGLRCNGEETCTNGMCQAGTDPCSNSVSCVQSVCVENSPVCQTSFPPDRCQPGEFCDVLLDCQPGSPCEDDQDCEGLTDVCYPLVCADGRHCSQGQPLQPNDNNPCTQDYCQPGTGPVYLELPEGNVCLPDPRMVCRQFADGGTMTCVTSSCGDGFVDLTGGEQCDQGGTDGGNDNETCTVQCRFPVCGDGYISQTIGEQCDDQNTNINDDCVACRSALCGDGKLHSQGTPPLEECDEGAQNGLGECNPFCRRYTFDVYQIMGQGAACPGSGVDGGPQPPPADGGWDYLNLGPLVNNPDGDSRCQPLQDIQDLAIRGVADGGDVDLSDEMVVADVSGMYGLNIRTLQSQRLSPPENSTPIRPCDTNLSPWVLAPGDGLPGTSEGVDGLVARNAEVVYRSAQTHRIFKAELGTPTPSQATMQFLNYVGDINSGGIGNCCGVDANNYYWRLWANNTCVYCPGIAFDGYPRTTRNLFNRRFLILSDVSGMLVHAMAEDSSCNGGAATAFEPCPGTIDAGPPPAGSNYGWKYAADVRTQCLGGNVLGVLLSSPTIHEIVKVGVSAEDVFPGTCFRGYDSVVGVRGQQGTAPVGAVAHGAKVDTPTGVGQDNDCNIYFAETGTSAVRQVARDGVIRTVATLPGLRTLAVHPTLGTVAATQTGLYLLVPRSAGP